MGEVTGGTEEGVDGVIGTEGVDGVLGVAVGRSGGKCH